MSKEKISSFREEYSFLSNFYPAPVTYNNLTFSNNEAAFQAQKCVSKEERIAFTQMGPAEAKKAGRKVTLRKDWEDVKISIMIDLIFAKFTQNPELADMLIATGDAYLEEGNTWEDRVWGTVNGQGANNLGKILMKVRDKLSKTKRKR